MRLGTALLAGTAALLIAGCGSGRRLSHEVGQRAYDFSTEWYAEGNGNLPKFRNAAGLREYLEGGFDTLVPMAVEFYNGRFGEDIPAEDIDIEYEELWMFSGGLPVFRYDLDSHRLVLEYIPHSDADTYAKKLGRSREAMSEYEASTFGLVPHEVAHWYHDRMLKKYCCRDFSGHVMGENRALDIIKSMIVEGTAIYMSKFLDGEESYAGKAGYANAMDSIMDGKPLAVWAYPAGEEFMTPILDRDFRNGIRLMSGEFPEVRTAEDLKAYQAKILERLDSMGSGGCP